jgi:ribosome-associated protein
MNRKKTSIEPGSAIQMTSKEKAEILLLAALSKKAFDPVLLRLDELTALTDYFLIFSGGSGKHVKSVAEAVIEDASKNKFQRFSAEGVKLGNWALLDYGDVIVHVFQKPVREFYDLEGLWAEAPREVFSEDISRQIEAGGKKDDEEEEQDSSWY